MIIIIQVQSDSEQYGYKKAHFFIQHNRNEPMQNYSFNGNVDYYYKKIYVENAISIIKINVLCLL